MMDTSLWLAIESYFAFIALIVFRVLNGAKRLVNRSWIPNLRFLNR